MSERIRMSRHTLDLLLYVYVHDEPRSIFAPGRRSVEFCGVPVVMDDSLPLGNFYRERV